MRNYHKQDMASVQWLAMHFFAKSFQRFKQFGTLPIVRGDRVLDLCCGPGLFTRYAADLVGPCGHVTALDHDPVSLDFATRYLTPFPFKNWDLIHADMEASLDRVESYDVILLMNCIGYTSSPESIVRSIAKRAKNGTRLIVKDVDLGSVFLTPMSLGHWARLIAAAKTANDSDNPLKFDNFLGRRVPFFHRLYNFAATIRTCGRNVLSILSMSTRSNIFGEILKLSCCRPGLHAMLARSSTSRITFAERKSHSSTTKQPFLPRTNI
jgi:SAM-dependent methyltransferase